MERPSRPLSTVDRAPNGAAWRAHTDGNWAPARGNSSGSVGAGELYVIQVTRVGTTVFGTSTSAVGRPLWDRRETGLQGESGVTVARVTSRAFGPAKGDTGRYRPVGLCLSSW